MNAEVWLRVRFMIRAPLARVRVEFTAEVRVRVWIAIHQTLFME